MSIYFGEKEGEFTACFTVHAAPQGKARPRVTRHGTYTPQKTKEYEAEVQLAYMMQCQGAKFPDVPLAIIIDAEYPIPKSTSKKRRQMMLDGKIRPTVKPDADNVAKAICDALNGEAWKDDAQVCTLIVRKVYGENPKVHVQIRQVETE